MTNNLITLTIPNDDHVALRAFGKALEEMALAHGAQPVQQGIFIDQQFNIHQSAESALAADQIEVDTTTQQVESLTVPGATHVITEQVETGDPVVVDGGLSQGYIATVKEIPNPVDSTGTPWDERIHSASKALNSDGTWRLRRKPKDMDEAEWVYFVDEVKNELMGIDAEDLKDFEESKQAIIEPTREEVDELIEASNEMLATIEPPVTPPGDDFHTDAGAVTEQTVAGIPPIPVPPPVVVPPVPVADEAWTFPKLMVFLTDRNGKIDVPTINALLAVDGLAALTDLNAHPDKIGPFVARVKAHLGE